MRNITIIHPGVVLKQAIEGQGYTQRHFGDLSGVCYSQLNFILNGRRPLTADIALKVCPPLHLDPLPLLTMQAQWDLHRLKKTLPNPPLKGGKK